MISDVELLSMNGVETLRSSEQEPTPIEAESRITSALSEISTGSGSASTEIEAPSASGLQSSCSLGISAEDQWSEEQMEPGLESDQEPESKPFRTVVKLNLAVVSLYSNVLGLPLKVDHAKVSVDTRSWKRIFWLCNLSLMTFHTFYMFAGVFLTFTVDQFHHPRFGSFAVMLSVARLSANIFVILTLEKHADSFAIIWNFIIKYQRALIDMPKIKNWFSILFLPQGSLFLVIVTTFICLNPELIIQFRFAVDWALAQGFLKDGRIYTILVVVSIVADFWSWFQLLPFPFSVQHVLFLEVWYAVSTKLLNRCKTSTIGAHEAWRTLNELLVMLRIFNVANSNLLFFFKTFSLLLSIFCLSSLLLMDFNGDIVMYYTLVFLGAVGLCFYPILYSRSYLVLANLETLKLELPLIQAFHSQDPSFRRRIVSVRATGIWVGSFRTYERESLLLFYGFILEQVVSIVVSFK